MSKVTILLTAILFIVKANFAQEYSDAVIIGHVVSKGEHIPLREPITELPPMLSGIT